VLSLLTALSQPAVETFFLGAPLKPGLGCSSCAGLNGPTAKDSSSPVKEQEQPVPPKTGKSSAASAHRDDSDKKSTKGS
jgi:hypothetical protein